MGLDRAVRAFAGLFVLVSVTLAVLVDLRFLWFTAFVGANLLQSSFTRFCPLALLLHRLGLPSGEERPPFRGCAGTSPRLLARHSGP